MGQSGSTTLDHEDHLPRYQGTLDEDLAEGKMDGYSFQANYLGYTTVSKPPTALSIIQPPVKELYIKCHKQEAKVQKVVLRIIPGGLIFTFLDSGGRGEVFFDINSMIYFEGLRFQMVRANEKKPHALFVPLDDSKITQKDQKSAFVLDKTTQFLAQSQHPPMLTCVLRRPKGIKALDCHLFMFQSVNDVNQIVSLLNGLQAGGGKLPEISDFRQTETNFNRGQKGDVIRTEYGDYAIYRGNQMELKDDFFRPREENGAFDDRRDDGRDDRRDERRVEERRDERREESERKVYDWDYDSSPIDNAWRSVNKQYTEEEKVQHLEPKSDYRLSDSDKPFIAHSRERSGGSSDGRYGRNLGDLDRGRYDDRQLRASSQGKVPPPVAHKPASPRPMSPTGPRFGYGSPRDENAPYNPIYGGLPPERGSVPPGRGGPLQDQEGPPLHRGLPAHERGRPFQDRGPPLQERDGPIYSASNLEGRRSDRSSKGEEDVPPKPVAKVPPHLVAGIKVLPTNFNPQGVKLKPRSPNVEKHPEKNFDKPLSDTSEDVEYDNVLQKFDKMISDESSDYKYQQGRPTQHDREMYDQNIRKNWVNEDPRYNRESPRPDRGSYGQDYGRFDGPDDRRYIEQYEYQRRHNSSRDDYPPDPRQDTKSNPNRYSMPPMYDRGERSYESPNRWSGSNKSQSSYEMGGRNQGLPPGVTPENPDHNNRKKDAEIANMFGGHPRDRDDHFPYKPMPPSNNFEQSLGYYP